MKNAGADTVNKWHQVKAELIGTYTEDGCVDLDTVASVVKAHSGTLIPLVSPKTYDVRMCGQDDTVYCGNEDQLESWKDHYLPERMKMQVIGAIDDFPCDACCRQLVLLLCEDGNIYAYEDEVLHLVAKSLRELFESGMTFPGKESFNLGECFEDYTEEEYNEIMECSEIKEMKEAHNRFRESVERELLASLQEFKHSPQKAFMASEVSRVETMKSSENTKCLEIVARKSMPVILWDTSSRLYPFGLCPFPPDGIKTEEEYNEIMDCSEIKEVSEAHNKFRQSLELKLLESLTELKKQTKYECTVDKSVSLGSYCFD